MAERKERIFTHGPLSARLRFKLRTLNNFLLGIAVFVPCAFIFLMIWRDNIWLPWVADAVLIALLYYVFQAFLNKRAIRIRCPHCWRIVNSNTPWMCGACEKKNEHVDDYPFLNRCESCGVEPKAYQCHHENCGKPIFFTKDEQVRNFAFCINPPKVTTPEEQEHNDYQTEKRRKQYKLSLTNLDTEVKKSEQQFEEAKRKNRSPVEKIEDSWSRRKANTITAAEIYRREKKANAEKYKDDEEMLKWANEALDEWYESGDWERII